MTKKPRPKFKESKGIMAVESGTCVMESKEFPCPHCEETITISQMIFKRAE